jgi:hypothetical protein
MLRGHGLFVNVPYDRGKGFFAPLVALHTHREDILFLHELKQEVHFFPREPLGCRAS